MSLFARIEAFAVDGNRHEREPRRLQHAARAPIARLLDPRAVADIGQQAHREIDRLVDARSDDDLVRRAIHRARDAQIVRQRAPQRPVAAAGRIGQQIGIGLFPEPRLQAAPRSRRKFGDIGHAGHERAPLFGETRPPARSGARPRFERSLSRACRLPGPDRLVRHAAAGFLRVHRGCVRPRVGDISAAARGRDHIALGGQLVVDVQHRIARDIRDLRRACASSAAWCPAAAGRSGSPAASGRNICRYIGSAAARSSRAQPVRRMIVSKWFPDGISGAASGSIRNNEMVPYCRTVTVYSCRGQSKFGAARCCRRRQARRSRRRLGR